jgi:nitrile hydratase accessory protein
VTDEISLQGVAAPPLINGELLFEEPWQGRVFGMARALADSGLYDWSDFQAVLIEVIGDWDHTQADLNQPYFYYDHFLKAFERLLLQHHLIDPESLAALITTLTNRPHGHDHKHDHAHDH